MGLSKWYLSVLVIVGLLVACSRAEKRDELSVTEPKYDRVPTPRVLVKCKSGRLQECSSMLEQQGATIHHYLKHIETYAVSIPITGRYALEYDPLVEMMEEDPSRILDKTAAVAFKRRLEEIVPYGLTMVQAPEVWAAGYNGTGVKVCIIDSGIDADHQDFRGTQMTGDSVLGIPWSEDGCSHGTHVSGIVAAVEGNDVGVVGVAPGVSLHIERLFNGDCGSEVFASDLIASVSRCADYGANIISMSVSGEYMSQLERQEFKYLKRHGILSVAAAGNRGRHAYRGTRYHFPASDESVLSVGAVDSNGIVADFSQRNDQVDISAPGVDILSTADGDEYAYMSGTSMACPHVSAVAALLWQSNPDATPDDIKKALIETADHPSLNTGEKDELYGIVRAKDALDHLLSQCDTDCNDGIECTRDYCSGGLCRNKPISGCETCNTANDCTIGATIGGDCMNRTCDQGLCLYTEIEDCCIVDSHCNDVDACTTDTCSNSSVCVFQGECQYIYIEELTANATQNRSTSMWSMSARIKSNQPSVLVEGRFVPDIAEYHKASCITGEDYTCVVSHEINRFKGKFFVDRLSLHGSVYDPTMNTLDLVTATIPNG